MLTLYSNFPSSVPNTYHPVAGEEERPLRATFAAEVEALLEAGLEPNLVSSLLDNLQPPREAADAAAAGPPGLGAPLGFSVILAAPPKDGEGTELSGPS